MAAQLYSSIASSKAKRAAADAAVAAERQRLSSAASGGKGRWLGGGGKGAEGGPLVQQFPPSLKVWCRVGPQGVGHGKGPYMCLDARGVT